MLFKIYKSRKSTKIVCMWESEWEKVKNIFHLTSYFTIEFFFTLFMSKTYLFELSLEQDNWEKTGLFVLLKPWLHADPLDISKCASNFIVHLARYIDSFKWNEREREREIFLKVHILFFLLQNSTIYTQINCSALFRVSPQVC